MFGQLPDALEIQAGGGSSGRKNRDRARVELVEPQSNKILSRKAETAAEALERVVLVCE
jgi:hypothetical protein